MVCIVIYVEWCAQSYVLSGVDSHFLKVNSRRCEQSLKSKAAQSRVQWHGLKSRKMTLRQPSTTSCRSLTLAARTADCDSQAENRKAELDSQLEVTNGEKAAAEYSKVRLTISLFTASLSTAVLLHCLVVLLPHTLSPCLACNCCSRNCDL